jgi:hypothetical protein
LFAGLGRRSNELVIPEIQWADSTRIYLHHLARDGFNSSNSVDIACINSDFEFIVGDCFAVNLSAGNAGNPASSARAVRRGRRRQHACADAWR